MRHWLQLNIRNWRAKPGRTAGALGAIALGVGVVIWVTCAYESVRLALEDQVWLWIGGSHLSVESIYGEQGTVKQGISEQVREVPNVASITCRLQQNMRLYPASSPEPSPSTTTAPARSAQPASMPTDSWADVEPPMETNDETGVPVQIVGIDPLTEYQFRNYDKQLVAGRMLQNEDSNQAVIDRTLARMEGLHLGDSIRLTTEVGTSLVDRSTLLTIVGMFEHNRVAKQQRPAVITILKQAQHATGNDTEPRRVTRIDIKVQDTSPPALLKTERAVRRLVDQTLEGSLVSSASAKLHQVKTAQDQSGFVMLLVSCVALFTAFFIIISTLSIGAIERIGQFGTLRCLGLTRVQLAALVFSEAVPLGLLGTLLGIPVGLLLARLSVAMVPDYLGTFAINWRGFILAIVGGGVTTLAGAFLPAVQTMRVSPLAASRPQSQPSPGMLVWLAMLIGAAMIGGHVWMIHELPAQKWFMPLSLFQARQVFGIRLPEIAIGGGYTILGVSLLYGGYALITPALVRVWGWLAVRIAAVALGVRRQLLSEQVGRVAWRSAAICSGLMVGLSLIVSLMVHTKSLAAGWDFPKQFSEAFVCVFPPVPRNVGDVARSIPGIASSCAINESLKCRVYGKSPFVYSWSRFVAGEPEEFFKIAKLEFVKGSQEEAIAKLKRGGYILVTPEFVRAKKVDYGEKVRVEPYQTPNRFKEFEIAGVVTSPALDIAANYFNASGMLTSRSVFIVMGTMRDARKLFKIPDEQTMFLINFALPATQPAYPEAFASDDLPELNRPIATAETLLNWRDLLPERADEMTQIERELKTARQHQGTWVELPTAYLLRQVLIEKVWPAWGQNTPAQRWQLFREELLMRILINLSGATHETHTSVRPLKARIDRDLRSATLLFSTVPAVALIVAALGAANVMMANVTSRSRQLATLRAVGATRGQITRLIIGEALVLGTLGSVMGLALGFHAASSMNHMTLAVWGYAPQWSVPWDMVVPGVLFTMSLCLVAAIIPARRAARNNILAALQTT